MTFFTLLVGSSRGLMPLPGADTDMGVVPGVCAPAAKDNGDVVGMGGRSSGPLPMPGEKAARMDSAMDGRTVGRGRPTPTPRLGERPARDAGLLALLGVKVAPDSGTAGGNKPPPPAPPLLLLLTSEPTLTARPPLTPLSSTTTEAAPASPGDSSTVRAALSCMAADERRMFVRGGFSGPGVENLRQWVRGW